MKGESYAFLNPGSGPVTGKTTGNNAYANMVAFVADIAKEGNFEGCEPSSIEITQDHDAKNDDGRFGFILTLGKRTCGVDMPGLPLKNVRFIDNEKQNILEFSRLYVDGGSWVWLYAVNVARDVLIGAEE